MFDQKHESGLAVSRTHSCSFTQRPYIYSHIPPWTVPLTATLRWGMQGRSFCFTNHLIHCVHFYSPFSFCTPADVPKCCPLSESDFISIIFKDTVIQRKITWLVKLPVESVRSRLSNCVQATQKPTDPLRMNETMFEFCTNTWEIYIWGGKKVLFVP